MHLLINTTKLFLLLVQGPGFALSFQAKHQDSSLMFTGCGITMHSGWPSDRVFVLLDEPCKYIVRTAVVLNFY